MNHPTIDVDAWSADIQEAVESRDQIRLLGNIAYLLLNIWQVVLATDKRLTKLS